MQFSYTIMTEQLQNWLDKLSDNELLLMRLAVGFTRFDITTDLFATASKQKSFSQKSIKEFVMQAQSYGIVEIVPSIYGYNSMTCCIVPQLLPDLIHWAGTDALSQWKKRITYQYGQGVEVLELSNVLFGAISNDPDIDKYADKVFKRNDPEIIHSLLNAFESVDFHSCLKKLKPEYTYRLYKYRMFGLYEMLPDLDQLDQISKWYQSFIPYDFSGDPFCLKNQLYRGNFKIINEAEDVELNGYLKAIVEQVANSNASALLAFDLGLEMDGYSFPGIQLPPDNIDSIFYQALLFSLPPTERNKRYKKIARYLKNTSDYPFSLNRLLERFVMNDPELVNEIQFSVVKLIKQNKYSTQSVCNLMGLYMTDYTPEESIQKIVLKLTRQLIDHKYYLLANEMLVIAEAWCQGKELEKMRADFTGLISFQPVLASISREEAWERPLNLLLSLGGKGGRTAASSKSKEDKSRVGYFFDPQSREITPFTQSRSAKGVWSEAKIISLRSFYACKTPGLTEQDVRIAKTLKQVKSYGGTHYEFLPQAVVELIGHPSVFLENSLEVPVDFVLSQPVLRVSKSRDGYQLSCDTNDSENSIQLVKETNTRYKVYKLTPSQLSMIRVLSAQQLVVPERGRQKLTQLLGEMSKYLTVHSDLIETGQTDQTIVQVEPDSRIRIQLLPFMDGLKVELYSKPFGDRPPYCKPGIGGKVLVANVKQQQLQVQRKLELEKANAALLLEKLQQIESVDNSAGLFSFGNPLDALEVLELAEAHPDTCVLEWPEGARFSLRSRLDFSQLQFRAKTKNNWFELEGELKVDEQLVLTLEQLLELGSRADQKFVELKPGEYLALSDELRKKLVELTGFVTRGKDSLQLNKFAAAAMGDFFAGTASFKADKGWSDLKKRVENARFVEVSVPKLLQAELRPYQEEGYKWMMRLAEWEAGACLADDMGLGKTIQTLAVLVERRLLGPQLVVCPVSVLTNWRSEISRFAPVLQVKVLGMSGREELVKELSAGEVLLTSYGLLQSESELLSSVNFATAVLDEAHIIKNMATKTSKASMQLNARFRIALTGTPVQNHPGEIWNLFQFLNPGLLGTVKQFTSTFIKSEAETTRPQLRKLIAPFILRRTKSRVLDELPAKTEVIRFVQLSDEEAAFYETLRRNAIAAIETDDSNPGARQLKVLAEITRLRQACCNVQLVNPGLKMESSKLSSFLEIVDELRENHHRALVFSQFVAHLSLVRKALDRLGISYLYLDGSTPPAQREQLVKAFQNGEGELFLISLKAGGLGLNLTAADYVIHLDPWWNPAIEDQASDRAHRIGQTRPVTVYRLVAATTIEEKIIQLHQTKKELADSLLEGSDLSARLSYQEMVDLLRESE